MREAVDRRPGHLRGRVLPHPRRGDLRPSGRPCARVRGGRRTLVARYAGRVADGFICTSGRAASCMPTSWSRPSTGLDLAGRDRGSIDRMVEVKVSWDPDPGLALSNTRFWAPLSLSAEQKHSIQPGGDGARRGRAADRAGGPALGRGLSSRGRRQALRMYSDLGFDHLVVHGQGDQERFLSTFAEQVLPGLRGSCRRGVDGAGRDSAHDGQRWLRWSEVLGVNHNADGGQLLGEMRYVVGHLLGRVSARLCDITHSPMRRKAGLGSSRLALPAAAAGGAPQRDPCRGRPRRAFGSPSGGVCRRRGRSGPRRARSDDLAGVDGSVEAFEQLLLGGCRSVGQAPRSPSDTQARARRIPCAAATATAREGSSASLCRAPYFDAVAPAPDPGAVAL